MVRRRRVTLTVSGLLLAVFAVGAYLEPVPYAELTPGPTFDTLGSYGGTPLITITGHQTYNSAGQLRMVTVGVSDESYQMPLGTAIMGWFNTGEAIVPKETIYPQNTTQQQSDEQNTLEFSDSQTEAIDAALTALGIKPTGTAVVVAAVDESDPAATKLDPGDIITAVNGHAVSATGNAGLSQVTAVIQALTPGSKVTFAVNRNGQQQTVTTGTVKNSSGKASVGIVVESENTYPFTVDIQLNGVGGPSAGMMFALGIIDKLTPGGLTGGRVVAGTGTIDGQGNVGPIGGIQMKTIGARRDGATVFLAPAGDCAEAKQNLPGGLELVKVSTLQDALNALTDLRDGKTPPSC